MAIRVVSLRFIKIWGIKQVSSVKNFHLVNLTRSHIYIYFPYVLLDMGITSYSHPRVSHYLIFLVLKFRVFSCSWIWGITSYSQSMASHSLILLVLNFQVFSTSLLCLRPSAKSCNSHHMQFLVIHGHSHAKPSPYTPPTPIISLYTVEP